MGFIRDMLSGRTAPVFDLAGVTAEDAGTLLPADIPPEVYGLASYSSPIAKAPKIERDLAIQCTAVKRSRDLIAGTLAGLPIELTGPNRIEGYSELLDQPERDRPRSVTMARLFEDMMFEGVAWWQVTARAWHGYPTKVRRLAPGVVTEDQATGQILVNGRAADPAQLIRFDSPTDALLVAGARAIRTCLILDASAGRYADGAPPLDYFSPADGMDTLDPEEVKEVLNEWTAARQKRSTAYVPGALKYDTAGWNPEQLQLADARNHAVLEISRVAGVDAEELGVSTTSRTYANQFDRRKAFTDFTLGQYRQAFEDRMSMGDLTPRGYAAKMNLDAFLRSDTKTRMETYQLGLGVGAYTHDEIRELEDRAPLSADQIAALAPATPPADQAPAAPRQVRSEIVAAESPAGQSFDDADPAVRLAFEQPATAPTFEVDVEKRIIRGLAVPYGVIGRSGGMSWQFSQGSLAYGDVTRVKLWIQHNKNDAVGYAFELDDRPDGLWAAFQVDDSPEGDRALMKAKGKVWDGLSIGLKEGGKFTTRAGVNHAVTAPLMEISLTPAPSFDDSRVHHVAASAQPGGNDMPCSKCGKIHGAGITECNPADVATFEAASGPPAGAPAGTEAITAAIAAGFSAISLAPPERIDPSGGPQFEVTEQPLYRFDGVPGKESLTDDMRSALFGDTDARQRLDTFFGENFAVDTTNTAGLNPPKNRPDMYVPQLQYARPLWDMVTNGSVEDKTPFIVPKFQSAANLVKPHVEGVEPSPGSFSATTQTITPSAVSGKIEINREVLDQGGSPQADQIIFTEMVAGYYEALEQRIAAKLASVATVEINLGSAVDAALVGQFKRTLAGLQFVRGGNRFTSLALDGQLFPALVDAKDNTGRDLLPVYGPQNTSGATSSAFDRVSIGGLTGRAAWALGAGNAAQSYLFVPSSVYAWASAPRKFQFEYQLKSVDIGIWGYGAEAITRDTDVRPIDYTSLDA